MEREELDAMWERIKALEENSLKVSKALGEQSTLSIFGLMNVSVSARGHHEKFSAYMVPKAQEAGEQIKHAANVDEVIKIMEQFTNDCLNFATALLK